MGSSRMGDEDIMSRVTDVVNSAILNLDMSYFTDRATPKREKMAFTENVSSVVQPSIVVYNEKYRSRPLLLRRLQEKIVRCGPMML